MGIKRLIIKDCLGIEELVLNVKQLNIISGGNEKGKTSILETIEKCLYNTKRRAKFVRSGADKAYIELTTDDGIEICRTINEDEAGLDTGNVKVTQGGHPVKAPETFLKKLFAVTNKNRQDIFAFNPVDFIQKKDTEQTDILLSLMPITVTAANALEWFGEAPKVDYEKHGLQVLKALEEWFYEARREANARVGAVSDECVAVAKRLPDNYELKDWEDVNLGELFAELNDAQEVNRNIEGIKKRIEEYPADLEAINNKYRIQKKEAQEVENAEYEEAKASVQEQKKIIQDQLNAVNAQVAALVKERLRLTVKLEDIDAISLAEKKAGIERLTKEKIRQIDFDMAEEIVLLGSVRESGEKFLKDNLPRLILSRKQNCEEAEKMKAYIPLAKEVESLHCRLNDEEEIAQQYDDCVKATRKKPHELLATVELPVKGLGIDGVGNVTINGLPLSNLSTAQQVKTCLDIARAIAKDTALKLICVDKVEHLDETVRAEFLQQVESDQDYQYFVTIVTNGELKIETK